MRALDWSLVFSGIAVTVSLLSATVTVLQKRYETLRVVRQQITEALSKVIALAYQQAELTMDTSVDQTTPQFQGKLGYIFRQHTFYSRHAIFLMERSPKIVSDADYIALAEAFQQVGDYAEANLNYESAIRKARNSFSRCVNMRMAADARYYQSDHDSGAAMYAEALKTISGNSHHARVMRGFTYQLWARSEAMYHDRARAAELFAKAEETYKTIQAQNVRNFNLEQLANDRRRLLGDTTQAAPFSTP
jgi:tetratricopeptide (TPR) repeat protein